MKRVFVGLLAVIGLSLLSCFSAHALSSDAKLFVSADNTFYAYVKAGESVSAEFLRVPHEEPFDTVRGDVTITLEGPDVPAEKCVAPRDAAIGQGCRFAPRIAEKTGIWRIQFSAPAAAKTYPEVSSVVKWGGNLFRWNIAVLSSGTEQHGRLWTERYAIRQPAAASFSGDFMYYYVSEDGYIYRASYKGYNGQISTLSADAIGIRSGEGCVSAYQSTEVSNTKFSPALGSCGSAYKLFFEEPAGDLPAKAVTWDDKEDWVRPGISRPTVSELNFMSDNSTDQQSGTISFFLRNFIGQYQIKIDVDNDGSFDGQDDVAMNQQMKKLSNGLQSIRFDGADKAGQVISPRQTIGIKIEITKVAEIHLVAADVEGRSGGLELIRLNGDNAPTTRLCWNDTELPALTDSLMTSLVDGRNCPDSTKGVHGWAYTDGSWGNARYVDDWIYASTTLEGKNTIIYPEAIQGQAAAVNRNWTAAIIAAVGGFVVIAIAITVIVAKRRRRQAAPVTPPEYQPPVLFNAQYPPQDTSVPPGETPPRSDRP